jgi:hypothetical protein
MKQSSVEIILHVRRVPRAVCWWVKRYFQYRLQGQSSILCDTVQQYLTAIVSPHHISPGLARARAAREALSMKVHQASNQSIEVHWAGLQLGQACFS